MDLWSGPLDLGAFRWDHGIPVGLGQPRLCTHDLDSGIHFSNSSLGAGLSSFFIGGDGITDYTLIRFFFFHIGGASLIFF